MRIAIVRDTPDAEVIKRRGRQNKEFYKESDIEDVRVALTTLGHEVAVFEGDIELIARLGRFFKGSEGVEPLPYLVFNLAYGVQGEGRYTQTPSMLEMAGIPYTGSGPRAHTVSLDKYLTKLMLEKAGLPTPAFQILTSKDTSLADHLAYPVVVKPQFESTSFDVVVVEDDVGLRHAVTKIATDFDEPALAEQFIDGKEVNCGILGNDPPHPLPVIEIDFGNLKGLDAILSYEVKRDRVATHAVPDGISDSVIANVQDLTIKTFQVIGCADCARVDFRIDQDGKPWILEINSMVAVHEASSFFYAAQTEGMTFVQLINHIVTAALGRYSGPA